MLSVVNLSRAKTYQYYLRTWSTDNKVGMRKTRHGTHSTVLFTSDTTAS